MRINDLRFLLEIAHSKSITLTAEKMHISQQGLSQMITRMEHDLNAILLQRSRHGVSLTEAGQITLTKAKVILKAYDELQKELEWLSRDQAVPLTGDLTLFHSHTSGTTVLPRALKLFKAKYPNVTLTIEETPPLETINRIKREPTSVGLINFPEAYYQDPEKCPLYASPDLSYKEVYRDDLVLCVPKSWPIAQQKIKAKMLANLPIVYYDTVQYAEIISLIFQDADQSPTVFLKTLNNELFRQTMIDGLAMGVVSDLELSNYRLLKECSVQPLRLSFIYTWVSSANVPMSQQAQAFVKCLETSLTNPKNFYDP